MANPLCDESWDIIVIGTGMGGATAGYALARNGHKVLFLEKGHHVELPGESDDWACSSNPEVRLRTGHWPLPIRTRTNFGSTDFYAPLGCGSGGSSRLYASQLERLRPCDFEPRRHHSEAVDTTVPERWPFEYVELIPYYRQAEELYEVTGTEDPLNPDPESKVRPPQEMCPRDRSVFDTFRSCGLHPYRAHVGARFVPGCNGCGGITCARSCKSDAVRVCLVPAIRGWGAVLLSDCEVMRLEATKARVTQVRCRWRGEELHLSGKIVVLAAGALMTPTLLLKSRSSEWQQGLCNRFDVVGRNLMMHASDTIAVRPSRRLPAEGPRKAISLNDFYLRDGRKLGTFQSMGVSVSAGIVERYLENRSVVDPSWYLHLGAFGRKVAARIGSTLFDDCVVMASIIEDLPYWNNRVVLDVDAPNGMRIEYTYPQDLRERSRLFRRLICETLAKSLSVTVLNGDNNLNYGHVCGTCRAGTDPRTSVVDGNGRGHELENLYIVDASLFPSSGGINPSLTIAANALRIAEVIHVTLGNATVSRSASGVRDAAFVSSASEHGCGWLAADADS